MCSAARACAVARASARVVRLGMTKTLILDQDGLYDPTSFNHQLVLGIKVFKSRETRTISSFHRGALARKS